MNIFFFYFMLFNSFYLMSAYKSIKNIDYYINNKNDSTDIHTSTNIIYIFVIIFIVIFAGLMSGLTVGYLSIDDMLLEMKIFGGTDQEKEISLKIQNILNDKHRLLVTLLVLNALAMEALPLFLNKLVSDFSAILISITLVFFIGEVIPQALCTGTNQLEIAAFLSPIVKFEMLILSPINIPLGLLLDKLLGVHTKSRYLNSDLRALIELHTYKSLQRFDMFEEKDTNHKNSVKKSNKTILSVNSESYEEDSEDVSLLQLKEKNYKNNENHQMYRVEKFGLDDEQANIMISAIEMKDRKVKEIMIPIEKTFIMSYDDPIDNIKLTCLLDRKYSRIPVYSKSNYDNLIGLVRIKQLVGIDFNKKKSMRELGIKLKTPLVISPNMNLLDLMRYFKKGKSHMAFITEQVDELILNLNNKNRKKDVKILGIVTLEDVLEKMINTEIYDEDDYEMDKLNNVSREMKNKILTHNLANEIIIKNSKRLSILFSQSQSSNKIKFLKHYSEVDENLRESLL